MENKPNDSSLNDNSPQPEKQFENKSNISSSVNKKSNNNNIILIVILAIVVLVSSIAGTWYYMNKRSNDQKKQQDAQIQALNKQINDLKNSSSTPMSLSGNIINVPELGLQITVPDSLKDIIYTTENLKDNTKGNNVTAVSFSTSALFKADSSCASSGIAPPLGSLYKVSGTYPASPNVDNSYGQLIKQFSNYYISYAGPQAVCSSNSTIANTAVNQLSAFKTALNSIK